MTYYSRPVEMPKTKRDGLVNFVQMVINCLEAGAPGEALLKAVDLREDIDCGRYDDAMADAKGYSAIIQAAQQKHTAQIIAASEEGFRRGVAAEKARMVTALGLEG